MFIEIKVMKTPNLYGYYGISYFDKNKKYHHFVMKSYEDAIMWVAEQSNYSARRLFKGNKFETWGTWEFKEDAN